MAEANPAGQLAEKDSPVGSFQQGSLAYHSPVRSLYGVEASENYAVVEYRAQTAHHSSDLKADLAAWNCSFSVRGNTYHWLLSYAHLQYSYVVIMTDWYPEVA